MLRRMEENIDGVAELRKEGGRHKLYVQHGLILKETQERGRVG